MKICLGKCLECVEKKYNCLSCYPDKNRIDNPPTCACKEGYYDNLGQL